MMLIKHPIARCCRAGIAWVMLALSGCIGPAPQAPEPPVRYAADLSWDTARAPVAMMFDVNGDSIRLLDSRFFGSDSSASLLRATEDTMRFVLQLGDAGRQCVLARAVRPGSYEGACIRIDGSAPWTLRLHREDVADGMGLSAWLLARSPARWTTTRGRNVHLHAPTLRPEALDTAGVLAFADSAAAANLLWLGEPAYARRLDLFLLRDRAEMAAITGTAVGGHADAHGTAALVSAYGEGRTAIQHELMHVMSHNLWGGPWQGWNWLREGVATAAPGHCAGWDLQSVAASLQADGRLLPLNDLVDRFNEQDDLIAYLQAGAFIHYLRATHGAEAVKALWIEGDEGLRATMGSDLAAADAAWRASLLRQAEGGDRVDVERDVRGPRKGCR